MNLTLLEWRKLHELYHESGLRMAGALLRAGGVRESDDIAKDVAQEAWTVAWRYGHDFDHCRALFFRTVRLRALDAVGKAKVRESAQEGLQATQRATVGPGWGAVAQPALVHAVSVMSCDTFETWYLKDVRKLTLYEVQEEQNIESSALNSRLARARNILKKEK